MRKGFTVMELLIFVAIFSIVMVAFITILVAVTRVQTQQFSENEVTQQSQFLLQQLQYYVEGSSLIQEVTNTATTTLELRMANPALDPTYITLSSGTIYLQQGTSTAQPLTSPRVSISGLTFTKRSNAPAHDSVDIAFTMSYNTSNIEQAFSQMLQTSVARVSAASFDSNVVPSTTNMYTVGVTSNLWNNVYTNAIGNGSAAITFSGSNVGVGATSPQSALQVNGGNIEDGTTGNGLILKDSGGTCWLIKVNTVGSLTTASTTSC